MKKIFTFFAAAAMTLTVSAQESLWLGFSNATQVKADVKDLYSGEDIAQADGLSFENGVEMFLAKADKNYSGGNTNATYNKPIKLSNGAPNLIVLPEGFKAGKIVFYGYCNAADATSWISNISSEVDGTLETVYEDDGTNALINVAKDDFSPMTLDDMPKVECTLKKTVSGNLWFKNGGKQPAVFIEIYAGEESEEPEGPKTLMSWDFTKWSDATVANLTAGANWSDIEKADQTEPTEATKDKCFWQVNCAEGLSPEKYLMANDVIISELEGLVYTNEKTSRSLAIAVDYPSTNLGDYHGPAYLWLGSKNVKYFVIPGVPAGATIKMGIESHKSTDARGVKLTVGETELLAPNGEAVAAPTTYEEQEWVVPADAAESNDVQITNTNGCHIYFITVTAGDNDPSAVAAVEVEGAVEYYNLQGVRVANPESGLYIKRQGNKAVKVLVK